MIRFWCSACGHDLEAETKLAGRQMACVECGAFVEVPNNPPPLLPDEPADDEFDYDGDRSRPVFPAEVAVNADRGLRDLQISLLLYFVVAVFSTATNAGRVAIDGVDTVFSGDPGSTRWLMIVGGLLSLGVTVAAAALRFRGYGRCRRVALKLRAEGSLTVGRFAVLALIAGTAAATVPPLFAKSPPVPNLFSMLLGMLGGLLTLGAVGAEFSVLGFLNGVLQRCGSLNDAGRVKQYAWTFGGIALAETVAGCVTYIGVVVFVMAGGQMRPGATPGQMLSALPPEAWFGLAGLGTVFVCLALVVCRLYWHILSAARLAVRSCVTNESPPEAT